MILSLQRFGVLAAFIVVLSAAAFGQVAGNVSRASMFDGEVLVYDGKVDRKLLPALSVAELTFRSKVDPVNKTLVISSQAVSKGTLLSLFRYSFLQQYESTIDLTKFRILKTTKHDVQKDRVRDSIAEFDYAARRVTFVETDPKDLMRPPRRIASEIVENVDDMISAIYSVRTLPLPVGTRLELTVSDSGLVYRVPFSVVTREQIKTIMGKVWCFRIEPEIFGPGKLIEQKGKMVVWMTDDARRIPVRSQLDTQYGKIDIRLKSYTK